MCRLEIICKLAELSAWNQNQYQEYLFLYHDYSNQQLVDEWFDRYGETIEIE